MTDVGTEFANLAESGPILVAMAVAALAGLISFLSPCVLPLVPGYLSYVTGLTGSELPVRAAGVAGDTKAPTIDKRQVVIGTVGFISGFTAVFVALNIAFGVVGRSLITNDRAIEMVAGGLIILLGIGYMGLFPLMQREFRMFRLPPAGVASSPLLGVTFALSWTPCVSPTLGAVIGLGATGDSTTRAIILAISYCAGLGLPFIGVGLGLRRTLTLIAVVRRHHQWVTRVGGVLLVSVGVALVTGAWQHFVIWLKVSVGPGQIGI